jgi:hypothetical protein
MEPRKFEGPYLGSFLWWSTFVGLLAFGLPFIVADLRKLLAVATSAQQGIYEWYATRVITDLLALSAMGAMTLSAAIRSCYTIVVNDAGLAVVRSLGAPYRLKWPDVAELKPITLLRCLDVIDASGAERLRIPFGVDRFNELVRIIEEKSRLADNTASLPIVFPGKFDLQTRVFYYAAAAVTLLWVRADYLGGERIPLLLSGIVALMLLFLLPQGPRWFRIVVSDDGVAIESLVVRRSTRFDEVTAVELELSGSSGLLDVKLTLRSGRSTTVPAIGAHGLRMYRTIKAAWERHLRQPVCAPA